MERRTLGNMLEVSAMGLATIKCLRAKEVQECARR
jgi:hypothetical protein